MNQGIQSRLSNNMINSYGCYFLCLIQKALLEGAPEGVNIDALYDRAVLEGWMDKECYILRPIKIYQAAGGTREYSEVHISAAPDGRCVVCNKKRKPMLTYTHFTLLLEDESTWDPLEPTRPAARDYVVDSYRVFV